MFFVFSSTSAFAATDSRDCDHITVSGYEWNPIYQHANKDKPERGIGLELLKEISTQLNINYTIKPAKPFTREIHQLKTGETDLMMALYPIASRLPFFDFTIPYYDEPLYVYSRAGRKLNIKSLGDLDDLLGVITRGASYGNLLDHYLETHDKIIILRSGRQAIQMLLSDRADFHISSPITIQVYLINNDARKDIAQSDISFGRQHVAMALSKKSPCRHLVKSINDIIVKRLSKTTTGS